MALWSLPGWTRKGTLPTTLFHKHDYNDLQKWNSSVQGCASVVQGPRPSSKPIARYEMIQKLQVADFPTDLQMRRKMSLIALAVVNATWQFNRPLKGKKSSTKSKPWTHKTHRQSHHCYGRLYKDALHDLDCRFRMIRGWRSLLHSHRIVFHHREGDANTQLIEALACCGLLQLQEAYQHWCVGPGDFNLTLFSQSWHSHTPEADELTVLFYFLY